MSNAEWEPGTPSTIQRTVLPIPDRPFTGAVMFDAKDPNSKFPPIEPLRPPKGADRGTPVSNDYGSAESEFNGRIDWIQIDLGEDAQDADHLITAEERYRVALALQ